MQIHTKKTQRHHHINIFFYLSQIQLVYIFFFSIKHTLLELGTIVKVLSTQALTDRSTWHTLWSFLMKHWVSSKNNYWIGAVKPGIVNYWNSELLWSTSNCATWMSRQISVTEFVQEKTTFCPKQTKKKVKKVKQLHRQVDNPLFFMLSSAELGNGGDDQHGLSV